MKKENIKVFTFCFLISFIVLTLMSKSSFLYAFNDWEDANAFFTMGKGMMNGKIIFKDLFEQKGPLLFFIYGIGYLISNTSFIGIYILELISFTSFLYFIHKIITLYLYKKYSYVIIPLLTLLITTSLSFKAGGSCEEFCFPMLSYTLYVLLKYVKTNDISYTKIFTVGFMAGLIFLIKYTLLGINFGFMFYLFFSLLLRKDFKKAAISPLVYLLGMFLPLIPWLIYFVLNNALYDFFYVYILINFGSYTSASRSVISVLFDCVYYSARNLFGTGIHNFIIFGLLLFPLFSKKINLKEKLAILCTIVFSVIFIYIGGIYFIYYALPLLIFLVFSLMFIFSFLKNKFKFSKVFYIIYYITILALGILISPNTRFIGKPKHEYVPYQFKEIIMQKENPTILNYGWLDSGFYTVTGIVPNTKYFEKLNFKYDKYPENMDSLNSYLEDKKVDFVIVARKEPVDYPVSEYLDLYYEKIKEGSTDYKYAIDKFFLYKLKTEE